jgi:hypothetical protein
MFMQYDHFLLPPGACRLKALVPPNAPASTFTQATPPPPPPPPTSLCLPTLVPRMEAAKSVPPLADN